MVSVVQQTIGAFHDFKSALAEQITDRRRVMDGFPDVFLEAQFPVFIHPDFQIHLVLPRPKHLEPHPDGITEIHLKRLAGGHLVLIKNIKDEIPAGA